MSVSTYLVHARRETTWLPSLVTQVAHRSLPNYFCFFLSLIKVIFDNPRLRVGQYFANSYTLFLNAVTDHVPSPIFSRLP